MEEMAKAGEYSQALYCLEQLEVTLPRYVVEIKIEQRDYETVRKRLVPRMARAAEPVESEKLQSIQVKLQNLRSDMEQEGTVENFYDALRVAYKIENQLNTYEGAVTLKS